MQADTAFGAEDHVILRKRRGSPEASIQRAIIGALRWHGIMAVHVPNGGKRTTAAGRRLKSEGMRAGFPDLACYSRDGQHGLMEVKAARGVLSDDQHDCIEELVLRGVKVAVVRSIDDALAAVRAWGWVRP